MFILVFMLYAALMMFSFCFICSIQRKLCNTVRSPPVLRCPYAAPTASQTELDWSELREAICGDLNCATM